MLIIHKNRRHPPNERQGARAGARRVRPAGKVIGGRNRQKQRLREAEKYKPLIPRRHKASSPFLI